MKQFKNKITGITAVIMTILTLNNAQSQNNLSITFRPSANFPVNDLGETKLNNGGGFEAVAAYKFMPHLGAYAGWGWNMFSEKESPSGSDNQFNENGYTFGLQFIRPISSESKLNFMIGGGGIYSHIETENKEEDIIYDTGHGLGWQAEAGLMIPIGHHNRWELIPTLRYRALSRDINIEETKTPVDLNYFSVGLRVSWTVWSAEK